MTAQPYTESQLEERTEEVFGDYVSIYDFQQSIESYPERNAGVYAEVA